MTPQGTAVDPQYASSNGNIDLNIRRVDQNDIQNVFNRVGFNKEGVAVLGRVSNAIFGTESYHQVIQGSKTDALPVSNDDQ
jgi:hypothetical protein